MFTYLIIINLGVREMKKFLDFIKKKVVLIPLGTIVGICTIWGFVESKVNNYEEKFLNRLDLILEQNNKMSVFEVNDSLLLDADVSKIERAQYQILAYKLAVEDFHRLIATQYDETPVAMIKRNIDIIDGGKKMILETIDIYSKLLSLYPNMEFMKEFNDRISELLDFSATLAQVQTELNKHILELQDTQSNRGINKILRKVNRETNCALTEFDVILQEMNNDMNNRFEDNNRKLQKLHYDYMQLLNE